ncbi:MAG: hypothetical protein ACK2T2_09160, partial [Anaerolineales bacterium]
MLQKQSISRNPVFYLMLAIVAVVLIVITFNMANRGSLVQISSLLPGSATAGEAVTEHTRAQRAESARLRAIAGEYVNLHGSTAWVRGGLTAAMRVEAARLNGIAGDSVNLYGSTAWVRGGLTAAMRVEAARLNGIAGDS